MTCCFMWPKFHDEVILKRWEIEVWMLVQENEDCHWPDGHAFVWKYATISF